MTERRSRRQNVELSNSKTHTNIIRRSESGGAHQPTENEFNHPQILPKSLLILAYLIAAVPAIAWCVRHSSVHGVESTFTRKGLSNLLSDLGASPLVVFVVIPFAIAFWPLLCLMDLSEIPKKKRLQKQLQDSEDFENDKAEVEASNSQKSEMQIGKLGVTLGVLSPMGQVTVEGAVWNASSSSKFIADGVQIIVKEYRGSTLIVEQTNNN